MIKTLASIALLTFVLTACGAASNRMVQQTSQSKAIVTKYQAEQAFNIVSAIDYLPFNYIVDGCYARDLYMSMELAAKGIPSSAYYIYGNLHPNSEVTWTYHVAPLLKIPDQEAIILDPAFEREPLTLSQWIQRNFPSDNRYTTYVTAGSAYFDEEGRASQFNNSRMVQNFTELPTFLSSDIAAACSAAYEYIAEEHENVDYKQEKLLQRTAQLTRELQFVNKLEKRALSTADYNTSCFMAVANSAL